MTGLTLNGQIGSERGDVFLSSAGAGGMNKLTANDALVDSLHQTAWNFTFLTVEFYSSGYGVGFNTKNGAVNATTGGPGVTTYISNGSPWLQINNGSNSDGSGNLVSYPANTLVIRADGSRYNSNTSRDFVSYLNGTYNSANYTTNLVPATTAATRKIAYGTVSDGSAYMASGRRLYGLALFNTMLTQAQLDAIRASFQRRWSV
ncbi:hypothetical protein [Mesorhizobium sp.]|uniref:hypothetical protein n=1 Tax=Mesorhizobium sp. TaxID=1871066 RepID=UPI003BA95C4A